MALEDVKSEVLNNAEQEAKQIRKEAEEKAEEMKQEARERAEEIEERVEEEIDEKKESIEKKSLANARMEAQQIELEEKGKVMDSIFEELREEIEEKAEENSEEFVENCIDSVKFEIGSIKASKDFVDSAEDAGFDVDEIDETGVVLISEDGLKRQDYTFDKIIEDYRQRFQGETAEKLFD